MQHPILENGRKPGHAIPHEGNMAGVGGPFWRDVGHNGRQESWQVQMPDYYRMFVDPHGQPHNEGHTFLGHNIGMQQRAGQHLNVITGAAVCISVPGKLILVYDEKGMHPSRWD